MSGVGSGSGAGSVGGAGSGAGSGKSAGSGGEAGAGGGPGAGGAGAGSGTGGAGSGGGGGSNLVTKAGEVVLAHHQNSQAIIVGADGVLVARSTDGKAHKIPPKTVLAKFEDGRIEECTSGDGHLFKFTNTKALVVEDTVKPLAEVIKAHRATSVFSHNPVFPDGAAPGSLQQKKSMGFVAKNPQAFMKIAQAVQNSSKVCLMWAVNSKDKKIGPHKLHAVNLKQIVVKAVGDEKI